MAMTTNLDGTKEERTGDEPDTVTARTVDKPGSQAPDITRSGEEARSQSRSPGRSRNGSQDTQETPEPRSTTGLRSALSRRVAGRSRSHRRRHHRRRAR